MLRAVERRMLWLVLISSIFASAPGWSDVCFGPKFDEWRALSNYRQLPPSLVCAAGEVSRSLGIMAFDRFEVARPSLGASFAEVDRAIGFDEELLFRLRLKTPEESLVLSIPEMQEFVRVLEPVLVENICSWESYKRVQSSDASVVYQIGILFDHSHPNYRLERNITRLAMTDCKETQ